MVLALDLGTNTGFAYLKDDEITFGHFNLAPAKQRSFEGGGMRFLRFRNRLDEFMHTEKIDSVHFEEVRNHKGCTAAHVYGGMLAILTSFCEENDIPYQGVAVSAIKAHATGRGGGKLAGKDAMIAAAQALGYPTTDDNEADAIHLLHYVLGMHKIA